MLVTRRLFFECAIRIMKRQTLSPSLLSWIRVSCHVANEESLHAFCPSRFPRNVEAESCAGTCWREKRPPWNQACLWFAARRVDDAFDDE